MQWARRFIKISFFPRKSIPADILVGKPNPGKWGLPTANFDSRHGHCDLEESFQLQTIVSTQKLSDKLRTKSAASVF